MVRIWLGKGFWVKSYVRKGASYHELVLFSLLEVLLPVFIQSLGEKDRLLNF